MEQRKYGEIPSLETRNEANGLVDRQMRYMQIKECLREAKRRKELGGCLSAKEIAVMMFQKGYIPTSERNFVSPRLTELCEQGIVEELGKKVCGYTGRKVTVYEIRE